MNVAVFTGKVFVGHVGLSIKDDGSGYFPVDEKWRHDLLAHEDAIRVMLEGIRDGDRMGWPEGFRHVYVNARDDGGVEINFYDCFCERRSA
jgi:hypothetical protein